MDELVRIAIPFAAALVTWAVRQVVPVIPKPLLPILATLLGAVGQALAGAPDATTAVLSGGAAVAAREIVDQARKYVAAR